MLTTLCISVGRKRRLGGVVHQKNGGGGNDRTEALGRKRAVPGIIRNVGMDHG